MPSLSWINLDRIGTKNLFQINDRIEALSDTSNRFLILEWSMDSKHWFRRDRDSHSEYLPLFLSFLPFQTIQQ